MIEAGNEFHGYLAVWLIGPVLLFIYLSRGNRLPGVLTFSYILGLYINHGIGGLVHSFSNVLSSTSYYTYLGFQLSTYALIAFMFGALLVPRNPANRLIKNPAGDYGISEDAFKKLKLTSPIFVTMGLSFWFIDYTPFTRLPSMSSITSVGKQFLLLGISLALIFALHKRDLSRMLFWLMMALMLPFVTVVTQGFIGYGISMLSLVSLFVAMYYRPRWHLAFGFVVGVYAALSLWVAYATYRNTIREVVWGGGDFSLRFAVVADMLSSVTPFDITNPDHVEYIDLRLNQNILVGQAVTTTPEMVPFQYGQTILDSFLSIIPRAIWLDKPVTGGSGNYVSIHTMQEFASGTSVGMGQVLELYINFGLISVLIGFFFFGIVLRYLDERLTGAIVQGDLIRLQFSFIIGVGALQTGGSLSEVLASMAAGLVLAFFVARYLSIKLKISAKRLMRKSV